MGQWCGAGSMNPIWRSIYIYSNVFQICTTLIHQEPGGVLCWKKKVKKKLRASFELRNLLATLYSLPVALLSTLLFPHTQAFGNFSYPHPAPPFIPDQSSISFSSLLRQIPIVLDVGWRNLSRTSERTISEFFFYFPHPPSTNPTQKTPFIFLFIPFSLSPFPKWWDPSYRCWGINDLTNMQT